MDRDRAIELIRAQRAALEKLGVRSMYLFGSTLRDEARPDSDVDLFFDYDQNLRFSLFDLMDVKTLLEEALTTSADVMTRGSLHPLLKDDIERTALRVF